MTLLGLPLPERQAELVLSTNLEYAVNRLVTSVSEAVETTVDAGIMRSRGSPR